MRKEKLLLKVLFAVALTSISVVIDAFFKYALNISNFGLPFYAIPLIMGSVMLGPIYGGVIALIGDAIGVLLTGYTYLPLYAIAALSWGIVPGIMMYKKYSVMKLGFSILGAYVIASLANTFANYYYFGYQTTLVTLGIRLALLPFNSVIIFIITKDLYKRLETIFPKYILKSNLKNTQ